MTQRLFVALWPSAEVVRELARELGPAQSRHPDLRWQSPERWHITLAFLGQRGTDKEARRLQRLRPPGVGPLAVEGSGRFGPVLWLGVEAGTWLTRLAETVRKAHDVADVRFHAHMTIARSRTAVGARQLSQAMHELTDLRTSTWVPSQVTLVESTVGPKAAYRVIADTPLTAYGP